MKLFTWNETFCSLLWWHKFHMCLITLTFDHNMSQNLLWPAVIFIGNNCSTCCNVLWLLVWLSAVDLVSLTYWIWLYSILFHSFMIDLYIYVPSKMTLNCVMPSVCGCLYDAFVWFVSRFLIAYVFSRQKFVIKFD